MKLTLVTCTGDRPDAFALCEKWMGRQTHKHHQWIVLDDGEVQVRCAAGQDYIYCPEFNGPASLINKISYLIKSERITGEGLVFIEDDDWYAPGWLQFCAEKLSEFNLIGEGNALYYNVMHRFWYEHDNMGHSSLCSTAVRTSSLPAVLWECSDPNPFLDSRIWNSVAEPKRVFNNGRNRLVVGIKGMPGRRGYGSGHRPGEPLARPDNNLGKLEWLIGADAQEYKKFWIGRQRL